MGEYPKTHVSYQYLKLSYLRRIHFSTYWHVLPVITKRQRGNAGTI